MQFRTSWILILAQTLSLCMEPHAERCETAIAPSVVHQISKVGKTESNNSNELLIQAVRYFGSHQYISQDDNYWGGGGGGVSSQQVEA